MHPFPAPLAAAAGPGGSDGRPAPAGTSLPGPVTYRRDAQALFAGESLAQALRQLVVYGRDGLPVLSADGQRVQGWVTNNRVLQAVARQIHTSGAQTAQAQLAAEWALPDPEPPTPLRGYQIVEVAIPDGSAAAGRALGTITWPPGYTPVSVLHNRRMHDPDPGIALGPSDRVILLAREPERSRPPHAHTGPGGQPARQAPGRRPPGDTPG
jgi:CIC family chloride channel protein